MLRIGLTGGIASGKSTVCGLFAARGIEIIDADDIAREVVGPGQQALEEIVEQFGPEILDREGNLDRRALRTIVFSQPDRRKDLEDILHPRIRDLMWHRADQANGDYCILAIPLLVEGGLHRQVDRVLVIDVSVDTQRARLRARDGVTEVEVEATLAAQASRETRLQAADDVIDNNGPLDALEPQVEALHSRYTALAAAEPLEQEGQP
ncbi:MAG: dephospho-CoA kinase [Xanthomonadales bacterium]|nr:dephospho-CoA kinase [Xanthomonadales bacterium]